MSDFRFKEGEGRLWQEQDKRSPKSPDYTGKFTGPDGVVYRIAAWRNPPDERDRKPNMGLRIERMEDFQERVSKGEQRAASQQASAPQPAAEFDDDIPF